MKWKRKDSGRCKCARETRRYSAEGISFLTARSVYDWRRKPYHLEDGAESKRWRRRSRLVAREFAFAEGKRDDFSQQRLQDMYEVSTRNILAES